jgi:predicted transcriptional regulator
MKTKPTESQLTVLRVLQDIAVETDLETPTIPELAELCNYGTTWTHILLDKLEERGHITRTKEWRSLQVTRKGKNLLKKYPYTIGG